MYEMIPQPCVDMEIHKLSRETLLDASERPPNNKQIHSTVLLEKLTAAQLSKNSTEPKVYKKQMKTVHVLPTYFYFLQTLDDGRK
jgi:hypothetical protein